MSAFQVTDKHIAFMVLAWRKLSISAPGTLHHELEEIARSLKAENARSVAERYPRDAKGCPACGHTVCLPQIGWDPAREHIPGAVARPCPFAMVALGEAEGMPIDPVAVIKAVQCYEYQACEHAGFETSKAKAFCDSLMSAAISALPGYREAPWGIS